MKASRLTAIVIEAKKTLIMDPQAVVKAAAENDIAIFAADRIEDL
jgi:DUF1009 family protein